MNLRKHTQKFGVLIRLYGYHIIFICALFGLILFIAYWSLELRGYARNEQEEIYRSMRFNIQYFKKIIQSEDESRKPEIGIFRHDDRLEIEPFNGRVSRLNSRLLPPWNALSLRARSDYLETVEEKYEFESIKITGESLLMAFFLLSSVYMFYRLILQERRASGEIKELWRRVSHEVITPTTGLKSFLSTIENYKLSKKEMTPLIELAKREIDRQEMMTENLVAGQYLSAREDRLNFQEIELAGYLKRLSLWKNYKPVIKDLNLDIQNDSEIVVWAFTEGLRLIINNLLHNSIKHSKKKPVITVRIGIESGDAYIYYEDDGPGIDDKIVRQIFGGFRMKNKASGAGLGLMISRKIARKMRGDIVYMKDKKEKGAGFKIYLQLVRSRNV